MGLGRHTVAIYLSHNVLSERIPGGYVVKDANGQSLAYVYARDTKADADIAKVLTMDASNIAKLPGLLQSKKPC